MAAPNIAAAQNAYGHTAVQAVTTGATAIVSGSTGHLMKVVSLIVANVGSGATADITADLYRSNTAYRIGYTITVPPKTSVVLIVKDSPIYVEEADTLRLTASANSMLEATATYEDVY